MTTSYIAATIVVRPRPQHFGVRAARSASPSDVQRAARALAHVAYVLSAWQPRAHRRAELMS